MDSESGEEEEYCDYDDDSLSAWNQEEIKKKNRLRALKMRKLKSPCGCPRKLKKKGMGCKHASQSGDLHDPAFVVERASGEDSTSASLIASSNRRIRGNGGPITVDQPEEQSISEEERRTIEVGILLGFDLD